MKMIEFFGMPRSGKTTQIDMLRTFLQEAGYTVCVVSDRDRADSIGTPPSEIVGYKLVFFSQVIEAFFANQPSCDFLIVDRGFHDSIAWFEAERLLRHISSERADQLSDTFSEYQQYVDQGFCLMVDLDTAFQRHDSKEQMAVDDHAMTKNYLQALERSYQTKKGNFGNTVFIDGLQSVESVHKKIVQHLQHNLQI